MADSYSDNHSKIHIGQFLFTETPPTVWTHKYSFWKQAEGGFIWMEPGGGCFEAKTTWILGSWTYHQGCRINKMLWFPICPLLCLGLEIFRRRLKSEKELSEQDGSTLVSGWINRISHPTASKEWRENCNHNHVSFWRGRRRLYTARSWFAEQGQEKAWGLYLLRQFTAETMTHNFNYYHLQRTGPFQPKGCRGRMLPMVMCQSVYAVALWGTCAIWTDKKSSSAAIQAVRCMPLEHKNR